MDGRRAFTVTGFGLLRALTTRCGISRAFDPAGKGERPEVREYEAIWDTGATDCVISERVVRELGLKPTGMQQMHTAGGLVAANEYRVNIFLPDGVEFPVETVVDGNMGDTDVLIGMRIIRRGDFAVTNRDGKTKFTFQMPSTHDIDFVGEAQEEDRRAYTPAVRERGPGRNDPCPCGSGKKYKNCCGRGK